MTNRLARETSPYLLQHAENPVDWRPWDDEALDEALRRDVPILLSVGYAACHWCHVMERESFEDPETARVMNENFVCIKVDREERPDIDAVYMEAVQAMTGHGGWPMTVFLTPEGVPFFGGTYFPPEDRHGLPSFRRLLAAIADTWRGRREEIEGQGRKLMDHLGRLNLLPASEDPIDDGIFDEVMVALRNSFDPVYGGFGGAPKFPQPATIDLLHRLARRGHPEALKMATQTLDAMASGGMYDQLAGGFARYSVDREWVVPHFEKMLYDNAQLLRTYAHSWQLTGSERHRRVAIETASWMLDEMLSPEGGFYSSIDADSEGEEGKFYVWTLDEVQEVTGGDAEAAIATFGVTASGNFEGKNIPIYTGHPEDQEAVERARRALLERRAQRVRPATDTKVLTAWNALAASALAEAGAILDHPGWIRAAERTMNLIFEALRVDGRLMRSFKDGSVKHLGFAEDHAFVLEACLCLFEVTGEKNWLDEALATAATAIDLFLDTDRGGFFTTGADQPRLVSRNKDLIDNAVPAANSVFSLELQRLALISGDEHYTAHAERVLRQLKDAAAKSPLGFGHLLGAFDFYTGEPLEIVVVGSDPQPFLDVIWRTYLPTMVIVHASQADTDLSPLLQGRDPVDERTTAYVCRRMVCKEPARDPHQLAEQLA